MELKLKHLLYQNSTNAPTVDSCYNDLTNPTYTRVGVGQYRMASESFTLETKVFLPNILASNNAPLIEISQGETIKGYVQVLYGFEDNEGTVYIKTLDDEKEASDDILDGFPLSIELYEVE